MNTRKTMATAAAALATVAVLGACSNSATTQEATRSPANSSSASPAADPAAHNQADMMFARMMIPHHQQAIEMSDMVLGKQGIDPRVVDLAKQIKAAQGPEIQQMQGWLNQWGMPGMNDMPGHSDHGGMPGSGTGTAAPSTPMMPSGSMMPGMPGMDDMPGMDGMMSPADMQALQNAQGVAASRLFLTQMIEHHQGAITMAQNEIKNGQFKDAVALATSIASSQRAEIETMNQILGSL
ncbi:DUF305 domain-containing protein [Mycobacterium sp. shizuoka-1]|uniref:DUF305 domain-containing protein n=1 Tax=Mycobacterium sp. shizuoka-1 TaxID=2039281 RepID=UPI000C05D5E4|nr:DUF305 domain-containing protein [Mycobacterium sp. shizuoka-1]GAY17852.1 DUF305 domain-containing protein [Mycobacterium sp. shizuoka-1]